MASDDATKAADVKPAEKPAADVPPPKADAAKANPLRRWVLTVFAISALIFAYYLIADRIAPSTNQAYVESFVVRVAPEVAGFVADVPVRDNQLVRENDVLFSIDRTRLELAVRAAEAALAQAGQSIGASTAQVASAQARLSASEASLINVREQASRTFELIDKKVYAEARRDQATAMLKTAEEDVNRARADLEAATRQLGPKGEDNPQIRAATAELERAQLDLARSTLRAPSDGAITNLKLAPGQFVAVGSPVMTFLDARNIWVVAELREKSLAHIKPGDRAEVVLDGVPGRIFSATVLSVGWGVSLGLMRSSSSSGLPVISEERGWVRAPQRFPVLLVFDDRPVWMTRYGSRASVTIYTGDNMVINTIAHALLRVVSWLGYVY